MKLIGEYTIGMQLSNTCYSMKDDDFYEQRGGVLGAEIAYEFYKMMRKSIYKRRHQEQKDTKMKYWMEITIYRGDEWPQGVIRVTGDD